MEWDRATEPMATLAGKISRYGATLEQPGRALAQRLFCRAGRAPRTAPATKRAGRTLGRCSSARFWVTTTAQLETCGPLGEIWRCLDHEDRPCGMADFETLDGVEVTPREHALGRRWQVPMPERWAALSPLRARGRPQDTPAAVAAEDDELAREWEQRRAQERTEAEHERQHGTSGGRGVARA